MLACIVGEAGLDYYRMSSGTYVVIARAEAAPAYATLSGIVVDAANGTPLPQARIALAERADMRLANDAGSFAFGRLAPGSYRVTIQAIGYEPSRPTLSHSARRARARALHAAPLRRADHADRGERPAARRGLRHAWRHRVHAATWPRRWCSAPGSTCPARRARSASRGATGWATCTSRAARPASMCGGSTACPSSMRRRWPACSAPSRRSPSRSFVCAARDSRRAPAASPPA